ncbi:MAG: cupredoxin domain-containing protein [Vulcanimicrobiaceae bacterium]
MRKRSATFIAILGSSLALAACGGGGYGGGGSAPVPSQSAPPVSNQPPGVGPNTVGLALPTSNIGIENDPTFGMVAGYTQSVFSQTLAFKTGTTITLQNLATDRPHALNVLGTTSFPTNPTLSLQPTGGNELKVGYASGTIPPGGKITVTLSTAGTYYIGCAYDYMDAQSMRDVIQVSDTATPGPQATPPASTSSPNPRCSGYYC